MLFLHCCVVFGWVPNMISGDVSNAFLQGKEVDHSKFEPTYMKQPHQGLPGLHIDQLFLIRKPVYGKPEAPRAWFDEFSSALVYECGFEQSVLDPALFFKRDTQGNLKGMAIIHVDDILVGHDGSDEVSGTVSKLNGLFPFGDWDRVIEKQGGVVYCGKRITAHKNESHEYVLQLDQADFSEGRLDPIQIEGSRLSDLTSSANASEISDFRSITGSLQWLSTQSRPDLAFLNNQLQKRVPDLRVADLVAANKIVRDLKKISSVSLTFENIGHEVCVVSWHDAALYNSVGPEIEELTEGEFTSLESKEKVYSQMGCMVGLVPNSSLLSANQATVNFMDWKSKTDRRIIESSFAGELHGCSMGYGMSYYLRAMLCEIYHASEMISECEDEGLEELIQIKLITDCRSLFDCIKKTGSIPSDKVSAVSLAAARQRVSAGPGRVKSKAELLWVPTRHQLADGLTKAGLGNALREVIQKNACIFHGASAKAEKTKIAKKNIPTGVKDAV